MTAFDQGSEDSAFAFGNAGCTLSGWAAKRNIISALIKAEITSQFGKTGLGFLGHVAEPLFDIGILVAWHHAIRVVPIYGTSVVLFVASGIYPCFIFVQLSASFNLLVKSKAQSFRGVEMIDIMIAKTVVSLSVFLIIGILAFTGIYYFDTHLAAPIHPLYVVWSVTMFAMLGVGAAFLNAIVGQFIPLWKYCWGGIARGFVMFGGGVLYVPDLLPTALRDVSAWNPIAQGVSIFRQGFYPMIPHFIFQPLFLPLVSVLILIIGVTAQQHTRKFVKRYRLMEV